jgi:hypothetical protein
MFNVRPLAQLVSLVLITVASVSAPMSWADESAETIEQLRAQLAAISARLAAIENQQASQSAPQSVAAAASTSPAKEKADSKIKMNADFRYRFESFDIEGKPDRHRNRLRARVGMKAPVNEQTLLGFELASGSDDPISSNQSLGNNFSSKQINLDQAYVRWQPNGGDVDVYAGKFKNPLYRASSLLWDGDLRPEGLAAQFSRGDLFANALVTWIDESKAGNDVLLLGAQVGMEKPVFDGASIKGGFGYYQYTGIDGASALQPDNFGNRLTQDGRYMSGFDLLEGFAEMKLPTSLGKTTLFANYVKNLGADDYDTGYTLGAKLNVADWKLGWAYQDLEADAVYGPLTDSDFAGGGTDAKGHKLQAAYAFSKKVSVGGTLFLNDRGTDFGNDDDYRRFMLDLVVKY